MKKIIKLIAGLSISMMFCSCASISQSRNIHIGSSAKEIIDIYGYPESEISKGPTTIWCYNVYKDLTWSFDKSDICFEISNSDARVLNKMANTNFRQSTSASMDYSIVR